MNTESTKERNSHLAVLETDNIIFATLRLCVLHTEAQRCEGKEGLFSPLLQKNAKKWREIVDNPNKLINFAAENIGVLIFLQECRLRLYP